MISKDFYINKDGFKLYSRLDKPEGTSDQIPLLILIHGLTGQMDEAQLNGVRDAAINCGIACLKVDMYGHGKSDGNFSNHNVMEWVCEIIYIIDYARELEFVSDIYLAGHSQGGLAVILAAAMKADQIKALIPISPAINIVSDTKKGIFFDVKFDKNSIPESVHFWDEFELKGNYIRVARTINVDEAIKAYCGPVLVVHGTKDESVDYSYGVEVAEKYSNSSLKLIEGDSHCYDYHLEEMVQAIEDFLKEVM